MKPIYDMKLIQIEITNACNLSCANCTRFVGHHKKPFFMDLDTFEKAVDSLEGYPGNIGIMGGEPTIHPQFAEILEIYREKVPNRRRRELWSNGFRWKMHKAAIEETFDYDLIAYNDHTSPDGKHQPLLIAAKDVIDDKQLMWQMIDKCWVQLRWSASITPKGAFFCEVAAAQDHMFEGPGGYPIEKGWWNKTPKEFADQVNRYCENCSAAIPLEMHSDKEPDDIVSRSNLDRLIQVGSPKILEGRYKLYDKKYTRADYEMYLAKWEPQNYRSFVSHREEDNPFKSNKEKPQTQQG